MTVTRLTLADLLRTTPGSSVFKELVASSRFYGLTTGGINSEEFGITGLGGRVSSAAAEEKVAALKEAVMNVGPFRAFFESFSSRKVPGPVAAKEFLTRNAAVPDTHAEHCLEQILADAEQLVLYATSGTRDTSISRELQRPPSRGGARRKTKIY